MPDSFRAVSTSTLLGEQPFAMCVGIHRVASCSWYVDASRKAGRPGGE
jgi:hypothetical protein